MAARTENRECYRKVHGTTLHRQLLVGPAATPRWACILCEKDDKAASKERKANGEPVRSYIHQKIEIVGKTCDIHNLVLPATGECDYC
jgi:hypothetical protein